MKPNKDFMLIKMCPNCLTSVCSVQCCPLFSSTVLPSIPKVQYCPLCPYIMLLFSLKYNAALCTKYSAAIYSLSTVLSSLTKYSAAFCLQVQCCPLSLSTVLTSFLQCYPTFPKYGTAISFLSTLYNIPLHFQSTLLPSVF